MLVMTWFFTKEISGSSTAISPNYK